MADDWCVLLLGGASGAGKSRVSHPLARRLGISVLETDDLVTALMAATTPEQLPLLHRWSTHPGVRHWSPERVEELTVSVAESLRHVIDAVVADHMDSGTRVLVEGDHLLPELAVGRPGVRGVVLHEPDVEQLVHNYSLREPDAGEQRVRAEVSALFGARLAGLAETAGVPVVAARPWPTAVDRTAAALRV